MATTEQIDLLMLSIREIVNAINVDDTIKALNETSILLLTFDESFKKTNNLIPLQKKINHFLLNGQNMRMLRLLQGLKNEMETRNEYYGEDIGSDNRLFYQKDLEKDVLELYEAIRIGLGTITKVLIGGEISF